MTDHLSPVTSPLMPAIHSEDYMTPTPSSLCPNNIVNVRLQERRRTMSGKDGSSGTTTPDIEGPPIVPFEPRTFPLSDEEYRDLLEISAQPDEPAVLVASEVLQDSSNVTLERVGEPVVALRSHTPELPSSTSGSVVDEQDDPNDPEWTVISNEKPVQRQSSIVLKLTKR